MGDGINNPFTRDDVERLLQANGGTANKLDLSGKKFEEGIDLTNLDLSGIILKNSYFPAHFENHLYIGAKFNGSNLTYADFKNSNLQYSQFASLNGKPTLLTQANFCGADLLYTNFQNAGLVFAQFGKSIDRNLSARFDHTDLRKTILRGADFSGCFLYYIQLEAAELRGADIYEAHLDSVNWGNYIIGEEIKSTDLGWADLVTAGEIYRRLKIWYKQAGQDDTSARFYYREMECKRKLSRQQSHFDLKMELSRLIFGYGEKWVRIFAWILVMIFLFAVFYFGFGLLVPKYGYVESPSNFWDSLYYSAASFTSLGYIGNGPEPIGIIKWFGIVEAFIGIFTGALFVTTFTRKWMR